jgi:hypothetical protein
MVVQEFIPGEDWSSNVLARDGEVTHAVQWTCPSPLDASYGGGRFTASTFRRNPQLVTLVNKIIAATRFSGVANFDARRAGDGRFVLFECNPRFSGRIVAMRLCGLDFVAAGLSGCKQPVGMEGDYYPWQEVLTARGLKALWSGEWKRTILLRDIVEMVRDPLPLVARKLTQEDKRTQA